MKPALLIMLSTLATGLVAPLHAEPVSAVFAYDHAKTAAANYQDMEWQAERVCKQASNRADTLVLRLSKDAKQLCEAELLEKGVAQLAIPELKAAHLASLNANRIQVAAAD